MAAYPQSVAYTRVFYAYLASDHVTPATGLVIVATISKAGAAFGAAAGTVTEIANGAYKIAFTTADTNTVGDLAFRGAVATMDDVKFVDQVTDPIRGLGAPTALPGVAAGANGGLPLGDASGRIDIGKVLGTAIATPATAGVIDVNIKNINNVAAATPGTAGGILIAGANAATTFATITSTGAFTISGVSMVAQTGDSFARIGAAGAGLTALGDARLANLDALISSRLATAGYTAPPSAATITAAIFANVTDGTLTFDESIRLQNSSMLAMLSGAVANSTGTVTVRDVANSKNRFTWTFDAGGNRLSLSILNKTL